MKRILPLLAVAAFLAGGCKSRLPSAVTMWQGKTRIVHDDVILSYNVDGEYTLLTDMFSCEQDLYTGNVVSTNGNSLVLVFNKYSAKTNDWDVVHFPAKLTFGNDYVKARFTYYHGQIKAVLHKKR